MDDKDTRIFFIKKAMIHEIYYTFYLQVGGETNNITHTVSARLSWSITVFLIARVSFLASPRTSSVNDQWPCGPLSPLQQMSHADCEFHVCMGVLRLKLEAKSIGIHEIPVPQNQIHIVKQTSLAHMFTEQLHKIKYHEIYYPRKF